ncbi:hypothetical protein AMTRI_Chr04g188400 [Amborella trichopoda]
MAALFFSLVLTVVLPTITAVTNDSRSDFIRTSCDTTLYPSLCYDSLSVYSDSIKQSPSQLARAAVSVSLKSTQKASALVARLGHSTREHGSVRDCAENLADALDQVKRSARELSRLSRAGFRLQMGNVQTWLSAAITNDDTCMDGFDGSGESDGGGVTALSGRVSGAKQVTSNALALVNNLAETQE